MTSNDTNRFESADGSHEIRVEVSEDRKHISGLANAMEEADKDAHQAGRHDDRPLDDCPLCPEADDENAEERARRRKFRANRSKTQQRIANAREFLGTPHNIVGTAAGIEEAQEAVPVREGKHYEVLASTIVSDYHMPTVVRWKVDGFGEDAVDNFSDPSKTRRLRDLSRMQHGWDTTTSEDTDDK